MKKTLSLLLVLAMVLGSFSFAFADEAKVDPAVEAGEFLKKAGVLEGSDSGDLMLDKQLKRQDAVVLLSRLMKAEEEAKKFPVTEEYPTFKDITNNYYKPYLAWAQANKYYEGHNAEKFGYGEFLTAQQYATVLLRALGYEVNDAEAYKAAFETAKKLGIMKDLKVEEKAEITRGQMAQMTFNALGLKMKGSDKTLAEFLGIEMPAPKELKAEVKDTENLKEVVVSLTNAKLANKDKLENIANYRIAGNVVERVEVKDNEVIVQVRDTFRSGKQYELVIKGVDKAIDGKYKFVAKDNTIPAVDKVEVLGEYGIKVVTTEPIEDVKGKNFLVDGRYVVMNVERYGRNLILTPYNGSFPSGAKTLTIEGLKDYAGYKSAKQDFDIEIAKDNEAPKVEDVILKGNKVEVVFDKDIYKPSVDAYYSRSSVGNISYELGRHTIYAKDATKVDTNRVVYEFKDSEAPSRRDSVTIVDVTNHSKVAMEKTTIAVREVLDDIEPELISKKIVAKNTKEGTATIELSFDKEVTGDLKKDSKNEFNVNSHFTLFENEVRGKGLENKIVSAKYDQDKAGKDVKDVIIVELKGLNVYDNVKNDVEYVLEIEGFADASSSRNKMYRDYFEFKFEKGTSFAIKNISVVAKGKRDTTIEIEFSKALDRDIAEDATNYVFYTTKGASDDVADLDGEATLKNNGKVVVLEIPVGFEDLKDDYAELRVLNTIKDTKGNRVADYNTIFNIHTEKIENPLQSTADIAKFKEDHKEALALKVETVKVEDKAKVNSALTAYGKLSEEARDGLKDEKDHLDKLLVAIEAQELEAQDVKVVSAKETKKHEAEVNVTASEYKIEAAKIVKDAKISIAGIEYTVKEDDNASKVATAFTILLENAGVKNVTVEVSTSDLLIKGKDGKAVEVKVGEEVATATVEGVEAKGEVKQQVTLTLNKEANIKKDAIVGGKLEGKVVDINGKNVVVELNSEKTDIDAGDITFDLGQTIIKVKVDAKITITK